jgi:hypothetical protein
MKAKNQLVLFYLHEDYIEAQVVVKKSKKELLKYNLSVFSMAPLMLTPLVILFEIHLGIPKVALSAICSILLLDMLFFVIFTIIAKTYKTDRLKAKGLINKSIKIINGYEAMPV